MKKLLSMIAVALSFAAPLNAQAADSWSTCLTVNGVSNYIAYSGNLYVSFTTPIAGCTAPSGAGYPFTVGTDGVTAANLPTFLAMAMAAKLSGHGVTVLYDSSCNLAIMSLGGYAGQCN